MTRSFVVIVLGSVSVLGLLAWFMLRGPTKEDERWGRSRVGVAVTAALAALLALMAFLPDIGRLLDA